MLAIGIAGHPSKGEGVGRFVKKKLNLRQKSFLDNVE